MNPVRSTTLPALTSIRFFAAVHIFVFHLWAMAQVMRGNPDMPSIGGFDGMPVWMLNLIQHGYCSTSLFFLLSGFVLAYLYVDGAGAATVDDRSFWYARFTRIYPLHIGLLVLIAPLSIGFASQLPSTTLLGTPVSKPVYLIVGFVLSATLTQAWAPEYALSWNFPTWALSAVVFFYAVFPWLVRRVRGLGRRAIWRMIIACPLVSLAPPVIYLIVFREDRQMSFSPEHFWQQFFNEFVMRTPLFWLPHFVMGVMLARVYNITRHDDAWRGFRHVGGEPGHGGVGAGRDEDKSRRRMAWGDIAAVVVLLVLIASDGLMARMLLLPPDFPVRLLIRHGLLAPLYCLIVLDLARGCGVLAKVLSWRGFEKLGEASFSIFMWQFPMLVAGMIAIAVLRLPAPAHIPLVVALTVAASLLSAKLEKKLTTRLRLKS